MSCAYGDASACSFSPDKPLSGTLESALESAQSSHAQSMTQGMVGTRDKLEFAPCDEGDFRSCYAT